MAAPPTTASQTWLMAQKLRRAVLKEIEPLRSNTGEGSETAHLETLENLIAKYRLACIETIWLDIEYAHNEGVDGTLWQTHSFINSAYRKVLQRVKGPQQVVARRKVEDLYTKYLKTAQYFYKGYVQRVCARWNVPQLERVARRIKLEEMSVPADARVDAVTPGVQRAVLSTVHHTLVYLGDLSRYRTQASRQKRRNPETAITYYQLATELIPGSVDAHHQMACVYIEEQKHFEIVYHLFRACAAEHPHQNARGNLEREFKDALKPTTLRGQTAEDTFRSWFVKLQAYFYKGEVFPQHAELEEEVLHRLEMALKGQTSSDTLLKMVIINICAYHVAKKKVKSAWTESASQSCYFLLRLVVRSMSVLTRVIKSDISSAAQDSPGESEPASAPKVPLSTSCRYSAVTAAALPLLRVYMTWLCVHESDIVNYRSHLEPYISDMLKVLASVVSSFVDLIGDREDLSTAPYLLREDIEAAGLEALEVKDISPGCRLQYDSVRQSNKPRRHESENMASDDSTESFTRVFDVLFCGVTLAESPIFPLTRTESDTHPGERLKVIYDDSGKTDKAAPSQDIPSMAYAPAEATKGSIDISLPKHVQDGGLGDRYAKASSKLASPVLSNTDAAGFDDPGQQHPRYSITTATVPTKEGTTELGLDGIGDAGSADSEYTVESHLFNMVNDFLAPPESSPQDTKSAHQPQDETSYGMHSSTANEIFGGLQTSSPAPAPGSASQKTFPSLPWDYFFTPTPKRHSHAGGTLDPASSLSSRPDRFTRDIAIQGMDSLDDVFSAGNAEQANNRHENPMASTPREHAAAWQDTEKFALQKKRLSFKEAALRAINQPGGDPREKQIPRESHGKSARPLIGFSGLPEMPGRVPAFSQQQQQGNTTGSSFPNTAFSGDSSLPPVNSPWGLPRTAQLMAPQQPSLSHRSLQPSGPYGAALPVWSGSGNESMNSGNLYQYSGDAYTAPTTIGRRSLSNRDDDPGHYGNAMAQASSLAALATETDAYNRQVLMSALNEQPKPRR